MVQVPQLEKIVSLCFQTSFRRIWRTNPQRSCRRHGCMAKRWAQKIHTCPPSSESQSLSVFIRIHSFIQQIFCDWGCLWDHRGWVSISTLPLSRCETLGQLISLCLHFTSLCISVSSSMRWKWSSFLLTQLLWRWKEMTYVKHFWTESDT